MSFGSLTPIAVRVVGTDLAEVRKHAEQDRRRDEDKFRYLRDVQFEQTLDYPTVEVEHRPREGGPERRHRRGRVGTAVVMATSSSRFIALNYWVDVKTGFDYQVEVQVPPTADGRRPRTSRPCRSESVNPLVNLMVRDVATVRRARGPASSTATCRSVT